MASKDKVRVSPGVYRDAKGITSTPPKTSTKSKTAKSQNLKGLTSQQNANINQRQSADFSLGQSANNQLGAIDQAYAQPFDYSQYQGPVVGDYNKWVDSQMGNYNSAYDARNNPVFKQQNDDFEQMAYNRGWSPGSQVYDDQKKLVLQSQNDARTQAYAANQGQAVQSAQALYGVGSDANSQALARAQAQRNQPLADFNALYGARSAMDTQNLGYSQTLGAQNNAASLIPRGGGGGGGGGGGATPFDINTDPSTQRWLFQQQYNAANAPKQPTAPNPYVQLGGSILGSAASSFAQGLGQGIFGTK